MNKHRILVITLSLGCASLLGALGCQADEPAVTDAEGISGTHLASVELAAEHTVELWQLDDGSVALREVGTSDTGHDATLPQLAALPVTEQFLALAQDRMAPAQLRATRERIAQLAPQITPALQIADASLATTPAPGRAPVAADLVPLPGGVKTAIDWNADAQWFRDTFCSASQVDSAWCPTNVTWADSGNVSAMYYDTTCLSASFDQNASFVTDRWNGSAWVRLTTNTLLPRHYQRWIFQTNGLYHANCASIASGGDSRVDFAHRFRWTAPSVGGLGDHPSDRTYDGDLSQDIQGITHDASNWYHTNAYAHYVLFSGTTDESHIWKTPVGTDLVAQPSIVAGNPWAGTYNHFGDVSYGANVLFVPLEPGSGGGGTYGGVGLFNTALQYYAAAYWPGAGESDQGGSSPWVAYNPKDNLLYSSVFDPSWINKYSWSLSVVNGAWQVNLAFVDRIRIADGNGNPTSLTSVQGGEFSSSGKLYLVSDSAGGVFVLDPYNGRLQSSFPVQVDHGSGEELEGITLWDLDNGAAPGVGGQIHVQLNDNDTSSSDDYYLKHYRASDPSKL